MLMGTVYVRTTSLSPLSFTEQKPTAAEPLEFFQEEGETRLGLARDIHSQHWAWEDPGETAELQLELAFYC